MIFKGRYAVQHIRDGKVIDEYVLRNGVADIGLEAILDIMFRGTSQISSWYLGLIDGTSFAAYDASDTMGSHAGWAEFTYYDESARQAWSPVDGGAKSIVNTSYAIFTVNLSGTIKGFFATSSATKSGTTGTLWSTAAFLDGDKTVVGGDIIKVQYRVTASA